MYALKATHISKSYRSANRVTKVLHDVNLEVAQGEMVAVMGPSGSGKTTLLNMLTGIDVMDAGEVIIGEQDLAKMTPEEIAHMRRKYMGMMFQDFQLLESLNVKENILLPLVLNGRELHDQQKQAEHMMKMLDILELADKGITEISGGQKQKVAIGRALVNEPKVVFCDEPTGSLDIRSTGEVMRCMARMNRELGVSFFLVTHDVYAASFCGRVLLLKDGRLASEVTKKSSGSGFREEIMKMLYLLGGVQDDIF